MSVADLAVMTSPCGKCPFRKDVPIYLHPERRKEIAQSLRAGEDFWCHETVDYDTDEVEADEGFGEGAVTRDTKVCAGAAKALMASGGSTNYMRVVGRLGLADLDKTEASAVEVWDLADWPRVAEGSTGDGPEWIDDPDEDIEPCNIVGPGCEAPAGYMTASGAVEEGTVGVDEYCPECGEPMCPVCQQDGRCLDCVDDEEE